MACSYENIAQKNTNLPIIDSFGNYSTLRNKNKSMFYQIFCIISRTTRTKIVQYYCYLTYTIQPNSSTPLLLLISTTENTSLIILIQEMKTEHLLTFYSQYGCKDNLKNLMVTVNCFILSINKSTVFRSEYPTAFQLFH